MTALVSIVSDNTICVLSVNGNQHLHGKIAITPKRNDGSASYAFLFHPQSPYRETPQPRPSQQPENSISLGIPMSSLYRTQASSHKEITEKKPSTVDRECLCLSINIALCTFIDTETEYPISTALDYFFCIMVICGWIRLAVFIDRWYLTKTIPYWRWNSLVLHIACCLAVGAGVVLDTRGNGLTAGGQLLGFTSVWICYGIIRFVGFLFKIFFVRCFIPVWLQIQRLIRKEEDL